MSILFVFPEYVCTIYKPPIYNSYFSVNVIPVLDLKEYAYVRFLKPKVQQTFKVFCYVRSKFSKTTIVLSYNNLKFTFSPMRTITVTSSWFTNQFVSIPCNLLQSKEKTCTQNTDYSVA